MIVLGFILVFFIGLIVGAGIICLVQTAKKTDIEIMLLQLMDQLKRDRKDAQVEMVLQLMDQLKKDRNTAQLEMTQGKSHNMNYGKYVQANRTIELIKKLYGGIC